MALIKCTECGHDVSDRASVCPNCGCPISSGVPERRYDVIEQNNAHGNGDGKKPNKWLYVIAVLIIAAIAGYGYFTYSNNVKDEDNIDTEESDELTMTVQPGAYQIILYGDGSGDFLTPDGSRLCGIGHTNGRTEDMDIFLTEEIKLMGIRTKSLDVIDGRLYAAYGDYLAYKNGKNEEDLKKGKDVTVRENDDITVFAFDLDDKDVQKSKAVKADLSAVGKEQYCIVIYPDKQGTLYGPGKKRICGLQKDNYETTEYEVSFKKEVSLYGKETKKLAVDKGNVYLRAMDVMYERTGEPSRRVGTANVSKQNGVTVIGFSGKIDPGMEQQRASAADGGDTENSDTYRDAIQEKGWAFICNRLKSPSTAHLVGYVGPKEKASMNFANAIDLPGLSLATYQVDAQNSFGAMIRQVFVVFFKNGIPMHMEDANSLKGDVSLLRMTLKVNGYDEI